MRNTLERKNVLQARQSSTGVNRAVSVDESFIRKKQNRENKQSGKIHYFLKTWSMNHLKKKNF